jgi:hypothetical protein
MHRWLLCLPSIVTVDPQSLLVLDMTSSLAPAIMVFAVVCDRDKRVKVSQAGDSHAWLSWSQSCPQAWSAYPLHSHAPRWESIRILLAATPLGSFRHVKYRLPHLKELVMAWIHTGL